MSDTCHGGKADIKGKNFFGIESVFIWLMISDIFLKVFHVAANKTLVDFEKAPKDLLPCCR